MTQPATAARLAGLDYHFFGTVESRRAKCTRARKVTVFRSDSGPDTRLGSDIADSNENWALFVPGTPPNGDYYAKVGRRKLRNGDVCRRDRSEDFLFLDT